MMGPGVNHLFIPYSEGILLTPPRLLNVGKNREEYRDCVHFSPRIKRRKVKTTDYYAEFGDRLDSLLSSGAQMGYSHEDTKPGSPDTHRGPHPPDTGYTPGVSEPCRAHIRTPKKPRRFSGEGIFQPGVGVLGTAVAYRPASVKTLHAEESSSGYGCQH